MEGTRTATAFRLTARPRAESPNRPRIAEACGLKRATEPASKFAAHADAGTPARIALRTSCVDDASKLSPMDSNNLRTAPFGQAFMA